MFRCLRVARCIIVAVSKNKTKKCHKLPKTSRRHNSTNTKPILSLQNKVAIITGASKGIGRATAKLFHSQNATIIGIDIDEEGLESLKSEFNNVRIDTIKADVTDENQVKQYIDATFSKYGKINILCNIAGGFSKPKDLRPLCDIELTDIRGTIDMNLYGSIYNAYYTIGYMLKTVQNSSDKNESCSIINMSSIAGSFGLATAGDYCISKSGVDGLTRAICADYGASGIRCNSVKPCFVTTPLTTAMDDALEEKTGQRGCREMSKPRQVHAEWVNPTDVAYYCLFLASDESKFINGSMCYIDDGTKGSYNHLPSMANDQ